MVSHPKPQVNSRTTHQNLKYSCTAFAAGLFTELGGDVVAFGVKEGAYRFLAADLTDALYASNLLP
jgi:hypothetical protein